MSEAKQDNREKYMPIMLSADVFTNGMSKHFPKKYNKCVPMKVKLVQDVFSAMLNTNRIERGVKGDTYFVTCNSYGALAIIIHKDGGPHELLGVKASEITILEYHDSQRED